MFPAAANENSPRVQFSDSILPQRADVIDGKVGWTILCYQQKYNIIELKTRQEKPTIPE